MLWEDSVIGRMETFLKLWHDDVDLYVDFGFIDRSLSGFKQAKLKHRLTIQHPNNPSKSSSKPKRSVYKIKNEEK